MKDIKAIYFDLDDTLCGYWAASKKALRQAFLEAQLPVTTDQAMAAWREVFPTFYKEIKTDRWYQHYLESGEPTRTEHLRRTLDLLKIEEPGMAESLSDRYADLRNDYLVLFPEAIPTLTELSQKYKLGLITNGPADVQRQEISRLGIGYFFAQILIEGEQKIGKPFPEIFERAEAFCGLTAQEMLFVGNAYEHDVQGAKSAGWQALWLNVGEEQPTAGGPEPDAVLTNLFEVFDWLEIPRPATASIQR